MQKLCIVGFRYSGTCIIEILPNPKIENLRLVGESRHRSMLKLG